MSHTSIVADTYPVEYFDEEDIYGPEYADVVGRTMVLRVETEHVNEHRVICGDIMMVVDDFLVKLNPDILRVARVLVDYAGRLGYSGQLSFHGEVKSDRQFLDLISIGHGHVGED